MPNLNNIFNNFFPQSQTGKKGLFLLRMAWTIEIFVAIIGFVIGLIIMQGTKTEQAGEELVSGFSFLSNMTLNDFSIGLIFMIVAVVELTKIPLATAVYYSVRWSWRMIFILGLLLVNVSTFETIVTGFERINRERTKIVSTYITKYHNTLKRIENLSLDERADEINEDVEELIAQRSKLQSQVRQIEIDGEKKIQTLKESGSNQESIKQLQSDIKILDEKINQLEQNKTELGLKTDSKVFGSNKKSIEKQQKTIDQRIEKYESERNRKNEDLRNLINASSRNNQAQIDIIKKETLRLSKPINDEIASIAKKLKKLDDRKTKKAEAAVNKDKEIEELKQDVDKYIVKIDELAPDNQVFRVATWLRDWFEIDYDKEIRRVERKIIEFENLKVAEIKEPNWFQKIFPFLYEDKKMDNAILDKQITSLEKQIRILKKKSDLKSKTIQTSPYADIPRGALIAAFWLWFGVLSFVISIVGTLLAFASLVLLDPRLHKLRNKKADWRGVAERLSRLFLTIRRYIHGRIHRLRDPVIKKVEVEVEKIVKEPVYVYKDKIVHVNKEIPIKGDEILRKEYVYVPFPTDDEELLKKGPFKAPDYDKDKKK